jgi:hypothetical protein
LRQRIRAFHTNFSKLTLSPVSAYSDSPEVPHRLSVSYRKHHTESLCIVSTKSSPIRLSADSVQCFTTYGFRDTEGKWPSIQKFVDMRFLLCSMAHLVLNDRIELFVLTPYKDNDGHRELNRKFQDFNRYENISLTFDGNVLQHRGLIVFHIK